MLRSERLAGQISCRRLERPTLTRKKCSASRIRLRFNADMPNHSCAKQARRVQPVRADRPRRRCRPHGLVPLARATPLRARSQASPAPIEPSGTLGMQSGAPAGCRPGRPPPWRARHERAAAERGREPDMCWRAPTPTGLSLVRRKPPRRLSNACRWCRSVQQVAATMPGQRRSERAPWPLKYQTIIWPLITALVPRSNAAPAAADCAPNAHPRQQACHAGGFVRNLAHREPSARRRRAHTPWLAHRCPPVPQEAAAGLARGAAAAPAGLYAHVPHSISPACRGMGVPQPRASKRSGGTSERVSGAERTAASTGARQPDVGRLNCAVTVVPLTSQVSPAQTRSSWP